MLILLILLIFTAYTLRVHKKVHEKKEKEVALAAPTPKTPKMWKCKKCDAGFTRRDDLRQHNKDVHTRHKSSPNNPAGILTNFLFCHTTFKNKGKIIVVLKRFLHRKLTFDMLKSKKKYEENYYT